MLDTAIRRMRTGKVSLANYRYSRGLIDSPLCDRCDRRESQTVGHIPFACPAFSQQRAEFWDKVKDTRKVWETPELAAQTAIFFINRRVMECWRRISADQDVALLEQLAGQGETAD
jgi:hypothetical protein